MALSEAFLQWEQQTQENSRREEARSLILRQLTRRVGELPQSARSQIDHLSLPQLEALGEVLLDFNGSADLEAWLQENG